MAEPIVIGGIVVSVVLTAIIVYTVKEKIFERTVDTIKSCKVYIEENYEHIPDWAKDQADEFVRTADNMLLAFADEKVSFTEGKKIIRAAMKALKEFNKIVKKMC